MPTTTGTEGNDTLTNVSGDRDHVVNALGGDDVIRAHSTYLYDGTTGTVIVNGGDGFDTLIIEDQVLAAVQGSGFGGSVGTRPGLSNSNGQTQIFWTSIERLELNFGTYGITGWLTTGDSQDFITLTNGTNFGSINGSALIATYGGDDHIVIRSNYRTLDVSAGAGNDIIDLSGVGTIVDNRRDARGDEGDDLLIGSNFADALFGGAGNDILEGRGGNDAMYGGAGNDIYIVNVGDGVDVIAEYAGEGFDELRTRLNAANMQDWAYLENLTFMEGTTNLGIGNAQNNVLTGNTGVDVLYGRAGDDLFMLQDGFADQAFGEAGRDTFYFGGDLTQADRIEGGTETDVVVIQGNYGVASTFQLGGLKDIEQLQILSGSDNSYGFGGSQQLSYDLTAQEGTVEPGQILYVLSQGLRVGETLRFDGSQESNGGRFYLYGSLGKDLLTGGTGEDVFLFSGTGVLNVNDAVNGGGGNDHLLLRGSYEPVRFNATTITNVERVALLSGNDPNMGPILGNLSYHFTLHDANVPAGAEFFLDASNLGVGEWALLDGSGDFDGRVRLIGGAGNDILIGGLGDDSFEGGGGADTLQDGSGDATYVYRAITDSLTTYRDRINGFNAGDKLDMSAIDAKSGTPENDAFSFVGSGAFSGQAGQLRAFIAEDGLTRIEGDVTGDGIADFAIDVSLGSSSFTFQAGDFIL